MSWLVSSDQGRGESSRGSSTSDFNARTVYVERDLDSEQMVTELFNGHPCVCAYASYELLVQMAQASEDVDHMMMSGRELKRRLKTTPEVGIMFRPNIDDEIAISWPEVAQVQRVSVE